MTLITVGGVLYLFLAFYTVWRELTYKVERNADKMEQFIVDWIEQWASSAQREIVFASGLRCLNAMNRSAKFIRNALENNSNLKIRIMIKHDVNIKENAPDLYDVLYNYLVDEKNQRIKIVRLDKSIIPKQHYLIVDGKSTLLSNNVNEDGIAEAVFSMPSNRIKASQFYKLFESRWDETASHRSLEL